MGNEKACISAVKLKEKTIWRELMVHEYWNFMYKGKFQMFSAWGPQGNPGILSELESYDVTTYMIQNFKKVPWCYFSRKRNSTMPSRRVGEYQARIFAAPSDFKE